MTGEYTCRDHRDDKDSRPPMKPIELAKQREAIRLLQDEILSDKAFQFKPELLRHLAPDQWRDTGLGFGESYQYPLLQNVSLAAALGGRRSSWTRKRCESVQEISLHAEPGETLEISEIFRALTDSIWKELPPPAARPAGTKIAVSTIRRNLQRDHVARLVRIVLGRRSGAVSFGDLILFDSETPPPADARALARQHLRGDRRAHRAPRLRRTPTR